MITKNDVSVVVAPDFSEIASLHVFPEEVFCSKGYGYDLDVYGLHTDGETEFDLTLKELGTRYESADPSIATVDENGRIEARAYGETTVTVRNGALSAAVTVHVPDPGTFFPVYVEGLVLDKKTLSLPVGGTGALAATLTPSEATMPAVTWSSSNESVATVAGGTVTAVAAGVATITAKSVDGDFADTCQITVGGTPGPSPSPAPGPTPEPGPGPGPAPGPEPAPTTPLRPVMPLFNAPNAENVNANTPRNVPASLASLVELDARRGQNFISQSLMRRILDMIGGGGISLEGGASEPRT